jgi:hypothetical protein
MRDVIHCMLVKCVAFTYAAFQYDTHRISIAVRTNVSVQSNIRQKLVNSRFVSAVNKILSDVCRHALDVYWEVV